MLLNASELLGLVYILGAFNVLLLLMLGVLAFAFNKHLSEFSQLLSTKECDCMGHSQTSNTEK